MEFKSAYDTFINFHIANRSGREVQRIKNGLNPAEESFAEHVWWPAFRNFDGLYPQYEVRDFRDGYRYIDFAYIGSNFRLAIEIDGFGPHWKDATQEEFSDHLQRQNHLVVDDWYVLRFASRDVQVHPRLCQQTIQQLIGRIAGETRGTQPQLRILDQEILRMVMRATHPINPLEVASTFNLERRTAGRHLKSLVEAGWLQSVSGTLRIHSYRIHPSRAHFRL